MGVSEVHFPRGQLNPGNDAVLQCTPLIQSKSAEVWALSNEVQGKHVKRGCFSAAGSFPKC